MMTLTCSVVGVSVSRTILATECTSMNQQEVEQLGERKDYNEGFNHPQSPSPPSSYVYLFACQPYSQKKKGILFVIKESVFKEWKERIAKREKESLMYIEKERSKLVTFV